MERLWSICQCSFYSRAKILGANLSRSEITSIYNGVQPLKGYVSTTNEVKNKFFDIISLSHKLNPQENKELLDKLVEIQQFKDRRMADVLVHHTNKVLLLAGSYHTSKKIGIPLHIQDFKVIKNSRGEFKLWRKRFKRQWLYFYLLLKENNEKIKFILCYGFMFC